MTDPSFARQLITFTDPHVGNYGVSAAAMESERIHAARGDHARRRSTRPTRPGAEQGWLDWLREHGIPGISGVDTRALVRHIRAGGRHARRHLPAGDAGREARERVAPSRAWSAATSPARSRSREPRGLRRRRRSADRRARHRHQALDHPQLHEPRRDARAVPVHDAGRRSCWPPTPTGSSSFPARATRRRWTTSSRRSASCSRSKPVFGICLGHQLLSRAAGLETFKLPFGHRGANHPVKDLRTGRIAITSPEPRLRGRRGGRRAASSPTSAPPSSPT